jgi:hypothetical protein
VDVGDDSVWARSTSALAVSRRRPPAARGDLDGVRGTGGKRREDRGQEPEDERSTRIPQAAATPAGDASSSNFSAGGMGSQSCGDSRGNTMNILVRVNRRDPAIAVPKNAGDGSERLMDRLGASP